MARGSPGVEKPPRGASLMDEILKKYGKPISEENPLLDELIRRHGGAWVVHTYYARRNWLRWILGGVILTLAMFLMKMLGAGRRG